MGKTRNTATQRTIFSCFQISKKKVDTSSKERKASEKKTKDAEIAGKSCRFTKTNKNPESSIKPSNPPPRSRRSSSRTRSRKDSCQTERRRSVRGQKKSNGAKNREISPFRPGLLDFTLSTRETEALSEVQRTTTNSQGKTLLMGDIPMVVIPNKKPRKPVERKRRATQQSSTGTAHKRRKSSKGSLPPKKIIKSTTLSYDSNPSTLTLNCAQRVLPVPLKGGIPEFKEFMSYDEKDIFGTQLKKFKHDKGDDENDCDTDDEEITRVRKL